MSRKGNKEEMSNGGRREPLGREQNKQESVGLMLKVLRVWGDQWGQMLWTDQVRRKLKIDCLHRDGQSGGWTLAWSPDSGFLTAWLPWGQSDCRTGSS